MPRKEEIEHHEGAMYDATHDALGFISDAAMHDVIHDALRFVSISAMHDVIHNALLLLMPCQGVHPNSTPVIAWLPMRVELVLGPNSETVCYDIKRRYLIGCTEQTQLISARESAK